MEFFVLSNLLVNSAFKTHSLKLAISLLAESNRRKRIPLFHWNYAGTEDVVKPRSKKRGFNSNRMNVRRMEFGWLFRVKGMIDILVNLSDIQFT